MGLVELAVSLLLSLPSLDEQLLAFVYSLHTHEAPCTSEVPAGLVLHQARHSNSICLAAFWDRHSTQIRCGQDSIDFSGQALPCRTLASVVMVDIPQSRYNCMKHINTLTLTYSGGNPTPSTCKTRIQSECISTQMLTTTKPLDVVSKSTTSK